MNRRDIIEFVHAAVYTADDAETVRRQLQLLGQGLELDRPEYLSQEHARFGPDDSASLGRLGSFVAEDATAADQYGASLDYLVGLIDLYSNFTRPR